MFFLRAPKCSKPNNPNLRLCQKGWDQATRAGIELRTTTLDAILCSPLPYAVQTAHEVERLHFAYNPPIEVHPSLIAKSTYSSEEVVMRNIKDVLSYALQRFRGKSILLISHEEVAQGFIADHLGESLAIIKTQHWSAIERGEIICRQLIED